MKFFMICPDCGAVITVEINPPEKRVEVWKPQVYRARCNDCGAKHRLALGIVCEGGRVTRR